MKKIYTSISFLLGIGIIYLLYKLSKTEKIISLLLTFNLFSLGWVILATFGIAFCVTSRWIILLRGFHQKRRLLFSQYLLFFLYGRISSFFIPKEIADIGVRSMFLTQTKAVNGKIALLSAFLDRLIDVFVILVLAFPAAIYLLQGLSFDNALGITMVLIVGMLILPMYCTSFLKKIFSYGLWVWKGRKEKISPTEIHETLSFLTPAFLSLLSFLSILRFFFVILRYSIIGHAYGIMLSFPTFVLLSPVAVLGYLIAITPGGLGFVEAGWYGVLSYFPLEETAKISFIIGQRIVIFLSLLMCIVCTSLWVRWSR